MIHSTSSSCHFYVNYMKKIAHMSVVTRSLIPFRFRSDMFHLVAVCHSFFMTPFFRYYVRLLCRRKWVIEFKSKLKKLFTETVPLDKCKDKHCRLCLTVFCHMIHWSRFHSHILLHLFRSHIRLFISVFVRSLTSNICFQMHNQTVILGRWLSWRKRHRLCCSHIRTLFFINSIW